MVKIYNKEDVIDFLNDKISLLFDKLDESRSEVSNLSFRAIAIRLLSQQIDILEDYPERIEMDEREVISLFAEIYQQAEELDDIAFSTNYEKVFICRLD